MGYWSQSIVEGKGVVKNGDNLYCYQTVDATHVRIIRTIAYTTAPAPPTYHILGDEAMERAEVVLIEAAVADWGFVGGGGKIYLWDGLRRVVTFDCATMAVTKVDDYEFDISAFCCDDGAYYIGQNGIGGYCNPPSPGPNPLYVYRVPITGDTTIYTGDTNGEYYECVTTHEHYVEHMYAAGGKLFISCGGLYTDRWLTEIDITTMTKDCRQVGEVTSAPGYLVGYFDFVTDGTYLYAQTYDGTIRKFTIGTLAIVATATGGTWIDYRGGFGMLYSDGHIYQGRAPRHVDIYTCSTMARSTSTAWDLMGFYRAITDGTIVWYSGWDATALCTTRLPSPLYRYDYLFVWAWIPEDHVCSFPWIGHFQMSKVNEVA
jgi:hypothetical protein